MPTPEPAPPIGAAAPKPPSGGGLPPSGAAAHGRRASSALGLAILAPASMLLTGPLAAFAMLATYPSQGSSKVPWVTPVVFFSLPVLFAACALALAFPLMDKLPRSSPGWRSAAAALCIAGLVAAVALGPALDIIGIF